MKRCSILLIIREIQIKTWRIFLQCGRLGFDPWVRKIHWRRSWQPLQYSCLENSMHRGAWQVTVQRDAKSQTPLKQLSMQIEATMRYQLTSVRVVIIEKSKNNKCWIGCGKKGTLLHCWWECKLVQPLWKTACRFLKKLGLKPPYDPAIPLLGICPEETKIEKDTCFPMFTSALFTIART